MKRFLYRFILPFPGLIIMRLLYLTYRIKIINSEIEDSIRRKGDLPIYASWHQRLFPGISFLTSRRPISVIVSRSADGDLISGILELMGWRPARGSSTRGGIQAVREVKKLFREGYSLGHIVDGPRGPAGVVKPGVVAISRFSGMPIIPIIISAEKKWVFNSWDRFMVPKPFSRVKIKFDEPVYVSKSAGRDEMEKYRKMIEDRLAEQYRELDKTWV